MMSASLKSNNSLSVSSNDTLKFNLYLKTHEISQVVDSLKSILLMPKAERKQWASDHEESLTELLEDFMQDASLALDGLYLDNEAMKLSMEFVSQLRDAMNALNSIMRDTQKIKT